MDMPIQTNTNGIFQSDIIVRTALMLGLDDIRANPVLLDYCFASLPHDELTAQKYGQRTVDQAKAWFLATEIPVSINLRVGQPKMPIITVELQSSSEDVSSLGDINYEPAEEYSDPWPNVAGPFAVVSYDTTTGDVVLPTNVLDSALIFPGMILVDRTGIECPITDGIDETTVRIAPAAVDFSLCYLRPAKPSNIATLESVVFRETCSVGVHSSGEPELVIWLSSIVTFILLRYKQTLLEARGLERSTIQATGIAHSSELWGRENVFSRMINLTGFVRQYWPKQLGPKTMGIILRPKMGPGTTPIGQDINSLGWNMDDDILSGISSGIVGGNDSTA